MRLYKYLLESKYKASPKEIKAAAKNIAKRVGSKSSQLVFIGAEDYGDMGKMLYFNVDDPKNVKKHNSTVVEKI